MKKIKWQDVKSQHDNDCWAIAISKATNKTYKEVYNLFKPFIEDGGLDSRMTYAYLEQSGYNKNDISGHTVKAILQMYDSKNNKLCIGVKDHVFYVENDIIYDSYPRDYRGEFYDKEVTEILYKPI